MRSARVRGFLPLVIIIAVFVSAIAWTTWARANHVFPFCAMAIWDTSWTPRSVGNLTKSSDIILIGSIAQVGPSWQPEVGPIITRITVNSSEVLKGGQWPRTQVSLVAAGGNIGCYSDSVGGEATFTKGEQVLVFLIAGLDGLRVTNGIQGKYTISDGTAYSQYSGQVSLQDLRNEIAQNL